jgi:hypothetical protein
MTADQIQAISEMKLTEDDSNAYVEEMGTQLSGGFVVRSESKAPEIGGMSRPGGGGGMPGGGGGMPGGGGMMGGMMGGGMMTGPMGWEEMSEEELAAAMEAGGMMTASADQALINALIMTLRTKSGEMDGEAIPGGMAGGSDMFMDTISEITGIPAETLRKEWPMDLRWPMSLLPMAGIWMQLEQDLKNPWQILNFQWMTSINSSITY